MRETMYHISIVAGFFALCIVVSLLSGCTAINAVTASTRDKSVAAGTDTWGGGATCTTAKVENPTPTLDCWFGRRKTWYVSIKDKATGDAAAEVVRASNSPLSASLSATGVSASNSSAEK